MNKKILIWIIGILTLIPSVLAQTGLFGDSGTSFLTLGVVIIVIFIIMEQVAKFLKGS